MNVWSDGDQRCLGIYMWVLSCLSQDMPVSDQDTWSWYSSAVAHCETYQVIPNPDLSLLCPLPEMPSSTSYALPLIIQLKCHSQSSSLSLHTVVCCLSVMSHSLHYMDYKNQSSCPFTTWVSSNSCPWSRVIQPSHPLLPFSFPNFSPAASGLSFPMSWLSQIHMYILIYPSIPELVSPNQPHLISHFLFSSWYLLLPEVELYSSITTSVSSQVCVFHSMQREIILFKHVVWNIV